jgi:hypothetical protein
MKVFGFAGYQNAKKAKGTTQYFHKGCFHGNVLKKCKKNIGDSHINTKETCNSISEKENRKN